MQATGAAPADPRAAPPSSAALGWRRRTPGDSAGKPGSSRAATSAASRTSSGSRGTAAFSWASRNPTSSTLCSCAGCRCRFDGRSARGRRAEAASTSRLPGDGFFCPFSAPPLVTVTVAASRSSVATTDSVCGLPPRGHVVLRWSGPRALAYAQTVDDDIPSRDRSLVEADPLDEGPGRGCASPQCDRQTLRRHRQRPRLGARGPERPGPARGDARARAYPGSPRRRSSRADPRAPPGALAGGVTCARERR